MSSGRGRGVRRVARIVRSKQHHTYARPAAWRWVYEAIVTGEEFSSGLRPGLRATEAWVRRHFPDAEILRDWGKKRNPRCADCDWMDDAVARARFDWVQCSDCQRKGDRVATERREDRLNRHGEEA